MTPSFISNNLVNYDYCQSNSDNQIPLKLSIYYHMSATVAALNLWDTILPLGCNLHSQNAAGQVTNSNRWINQKKNHYPLVECIESACMWHDQ